MPARYYHDLDADRVSTKYMKKADRDAAKAAFRKQHKQVVQKMQKHWGLLVKGSRSHTPYWCWLELLRVLVLPMRPSVLAAVTHQMLSASWLLNSLQNKRDKLDPEKACTALDVQRQLAAQAAQARDGAGGAAAANADAEAAPAAADATGGGKPGLRLNLTGACRSGALLVGPQHCLQPDVNCLGLLCCSSLLTLCAVHCAMFCSLVLFPLLCLLWSMFPSCKLS